MRFGGVQKGCAAPTAHGNTLNLSIRITYKPYVRRRQKLFYPGGKFSQRQRNDTPATLSDCRICFIGNQRLHMLQADTLGQLLIDSPGSGIPSGVWAVDVDPCG